MGSERKRILKFVLMGLGLGAAITAPFCFVLVQWANSDFFDVDTCFFDQNESKTGQEIAGAMHFPYAYVNELPNTISSTPHISTSFTDTGCLLLVAYRNLEDNTVPIQIMVSEAGIRQNPRQVDWACHTYDDSMRERTGFQSSCHREIEYMRQ
jgi:hypothetical protein